MTNRKCITRAGATCAAIIVVVTACSAAARASTLICARKSRLTGQMVQGAAVHLRAACRSTEMVVSLSELGLPDTSAHENLQDNRITAQDSQIITHESRITALEGTHAEISVGVVGGYSLLVPGDLSDVNVPFASEAWDTADMHDPGAPAALIAPVAGRYLVTAAVGFRETASPADPSSNLRGLVITTDFGICFGAVSTAIGGCFGGVLVNATESTPALATVMSTSAILDLAAGEVVQIDVAQSSGGPLYLDSSQAQMQKLNY